MQGFQMQPFRSETKGEVQTGAREVWHQQRQRKEEEQRLSDVQEVGSKKAPQIHYVNYLSAPRAEREREY